MKIAVLGANGRVAHAAAKAFLEAGHYVVAVTRNGKCDGLEGRVEFRAADAMNQAELIAATKGVDVIFNGINPPSYDKWAEFCMPMARNVVAALKANRAVQLFIGNVYNFGKEIPMNTNEETPRYRATEKAAIREDMEALFRRTAVEDGIQTIILRAGDFYGSEKSGTWLDLIIAKNMKKGAIAWPGPTDRPHAFAYLPDLGKAFARLAERKDDLPIFSEFHFAGHALTGAEFMDYIEKAAGRPLKRKTVSWTLFKMIGAVYPLIREVVKMNYLWFTSHSLDGSKLEAFLGRVENTPADVAIAQALYDQGFVDKAPAKDKIAA